LKPERSQSSTSFRNPTKKNRKYGAMVSTKLKNIITNSYKYIITKAKEINPAHHAQSRESPMI